MKEHRIPFCVDANENNLLLVKLIKKYGKKSYKQRLNLALTQNFISFFSLIMDQNHNYLKFHLCTLACN